MKRRRARCSARWRDVAAQGSIRAAMAVARRAFEQGDWLTGEPEVITHRQQVRPLEPGSVPLTA
jgi:hypothetical protein